MSGFILVCERGRVAAPATADELRRCAARLAPPSATAHARVWGKDGVDLAVINPVPAIRIEPRAVCLGALFEAADWTRPGTPPPDGAYALARYDETVLELVTDVFASRTIWYVQTEQRFMASTSQRALVSLLRTFEPCPETVTWLLASGNLGPDHGWDQRLKRVASRTRLSLDRAAWTLSATAEELTYAARSQPDDEQLASLWKSIFTTCARLDTDEHRMALTLSGGCDSRSILVALGDAGKPVRCVTWGLAASLDDHQNDATIARRLAKRFGMRHDYFTLDYDDSAPRTLFDRFLLAGEGRVEDFSGYTDGFRAWERLLDDGVSVVLRGDCPGWGSPYDPMSERVARSINMHCTLVSDHPEGALIRQLALAPQRRPEEFFLRDGEALDDYRDRIYNDYELPTCMSAMNDVKCAYVEVVNPLYGRAVVQSASELPRALRHCRTGFERLAGALVPDIAFSENQADESLESFLAREPVKRELLEELSSSAARAVLSDAACCALVAELERPFGETRQRLRGRVKAVVPYRLIRAVRPEPRARVDTLRLAYRTYIASRMAAILREDAQLLSHTERTAR